MQKITKLKDKITSKVSSIAGALSFLGSYQVCHNICMGIIALLSIIGITVAGMPLFFLTKVAIPFWIAAITLFVLTILFYLRKKCISTSMVLFNAGIIIAGTPISQLKNYIIFFWIVGGTLIIISLILYTKPKIFKHK